MPNASAFGVSRRAHTGQSGVARRKGTTTTSREPGHGEPLHFYSSVSWPCFPTRHMSSLLVTLISLTTTDMCCALYSWLEAAEKLAYPASLQRALGQAFGYPDPESFKSTLNNSRFCIRVDIHDSPRFVNEYTQPALTKLLAFTLTGLLDQEGAHLIAINGEKDTIFPIGRFCPCNFM